MAPTGTRSRPLLLSTDVLGSEAAADEEWLRRGATLERMQEEEEERLYLLSKAEIH